MIRRLHSTNWAECYDTIYLTNVCEENNKQLDELTNLQNVQSSYNPDEVLDEGRQSKVTFSEVVDIVCHGPDLVDGFEAIKTTDSINYSQLDDLDVDPEATQNSLAQSSSLPGLQEWHKNRELYQKRGFTQQLRAERHKCLQNILSTAFSSK